MNSGKIGTLILAAGTSSRLKVEKPKQLLSIGTDTMLNRVISLAIRSNNFPITLVLGYKANEIMNTIPTCYKKQIIIHVNKRYKEGMSTSLKAGLKTINCESLLILLADQPFISLGIIEELVYHHKLLKKTIRPIFNNTPLHPVLLKKEHINQIKYLHGDSGLKEVLKQDRSNIKYLQINDIKPFLDIDTIHDYNNLRGENIEHL